MSAVGLRADQAADLELYDELARRKLEARPGMANLILVHGRNTLPWQKRAEWDAYYVDNRSLRLDISILTRTSRNQKGGLTCPKRSD